MISFVNFARIASICVVFHFGTLHGYFFTKLLAKFEFPVRISNKTCLNLLCTTGVDLCSILRFTQRVQLLPILMFTRTATEARKRALFKYVTKRELFSKCTC